MLFGEVRQVFLFGKDGSASFPQINWPIHLRQWLDFCRFVDEVISKTAKDKSSKQSLVVCCLLLLNVGLLIVDRIFLGLYVDPQ